MKPNWHLEGIPKNALPREHLVGRTLDDIVADEAAAGHTIRVIGEDGRWADMTLDWDGSRVNLVIETGRIIWAGIF